MSKAIKEDMLNELSKHDEIAIVDFLKPMKAKHYPSDGAVLTHYWQFIKDMIVTRTPEGTLRVNKERLNNALQSEDSK